MKLFARYPPSKKSGGAKKKRHRFLNWKLALLLVPLAVGFGVLLFFGAWAQSFDMKKLDEMPERNTVFDVDGKIYSRLAGANRLKVPFNEVSPLFIDALLAREDTRFFEHSGVDWRGVLRALYRDIVTRSAKEGASSITQQLARNSLPLGGRTISRKLLEAMVAFRIEREYSKQQILECYMNRIYPQSKPFFSSEKSEGSDHSARHSDRSHAGVKENFRHAGGGGETRESNVASEAAAAYPGKLRDGCGPARFEFAADPGPNR
jgi:hypothetical protein